MIDIRVFIVVICGIGGSMFLGNYHILTVTFSDL